MRTGAVVTLTAVAMIAGCGQSSRTLLPDIPVPPGMTVRAVDDPGAWTRLTPDRVVALVRSQGGRSVGDHPVVRFLWLTEGPRPFPGPDRAPVWIVVSDDLPPAPVWGGDGGKPGVGDPIVVVPRNAGRTLTWAVVSANGESLGTIAGPASGPLPPN